MSLCLPLGVIWRVWTGVAGVYKNVSPIMIGVNTNAFWFNVHILLLNLIEYARSQSNLSNRPHLPGLFTHRHNRSHSQFHRRDRLDQCEAPECVDWDDYRGMSLPTILHP